MKHTVEFVQWDMEKIEDTAIRIVGYYGQSLGMNVLMGGTRFVMDKLLPVLKNSDKGPAVFEGDGFALEYRGPSLSPVPQLREGAVFWTPKEPTFKLFLDTQTTRPRLWNRIGYLNDQIADEAERQHQLHATRYPFSLRFPKSAYANRFEIAEAGLINVNG